MPPLERTWRWPFWVSFQGAYAKAAPGHGCSEPTRAELARQQVCASEGECVGEEKQRVVADERSVRARLRQHAHGCVSDERVRERQRVVVRPERVRLPEFERRRRRARGRSTPPATSGRSGSPRSFPMSLPRWRTSGQLITIARATPPSAAKSASRADRSRRVTPTVVWEWRRAGGAAAPRASRARPHRTASSARTRRRARGS